VNAVQKLSRITLICSEPDRLAAFYETAFGFVKTDEATITEPGFAKFIAIPGAIARVITLQLGGQEIDLAGVQPRGRSYPHAVTGRSSLFQHFAIVVSDMTSAYERLSEQTGWTTISTDGPQLLPASSGGATAFKFRDPDGHPLELIAFSRDAIPARWRESSSATGCLGIDHSAISIADTERSIKFYGQLGLRCIGGSRNSGPEQDRLDDVVGAVVQVTALAPPRFSTPHIELLCYRDHFRSESALPHTNDLAASRLVLKAESNEILVALCAQNPGALLSGPMRFADGALRAMLRDPDGHLVCLEAPR
jgi:catechol 2,3-dioxygenase-like lactoylglutathione lyase family enzyme